MEKCCSGYAGDDCPHIQKKLDREDKIFGYVIAITGAIGWITCMVIIFIKHLL